MGWLTGSPLRIHDQDTESQTALRLCVTLHSSWTCRWTKNMSINFSSLCFLHHFSSDRRQFTVTASGRCYLIIFVYIAQMYIFTYKWLCGWTFQTWWTTVFILVVLERLGLWNGLICSLISLIIPDWGPEPGLISLEWPALDHSPYTYTHSHRFDVGQMRTDKWSSFV